MKSIRESIIADKFPEFVQDFMTLRYPKGDYPAWALEALASVNIHVLPPSS
jgi:queuine tRNA-ribosyltransferase